ncbi:DUF4230 domain-containing protein [Ureibacillus sinduriensis]|uniref:DUF4230 domain-containing protein n=1 Tax=Ureibacillus sinduriensis BLB-1 = JCM 15800 TaxID=1384057 RepID=A0A0A3IKP4_9BACL|nr:DUF4230 domain-containing protein [Ureibacillus sinduriensis]KGR75412.1 hypothetical protein CD33_11885 [Ureibacillus sinduriensis BLB-1 = JCM 15800]
MNEKDEKITQFERVLNELEKGKEESAATTVLGRSRGNANISGALFKLIFKLWGKKILLFTLFLIAIIAAGVWFLSGSTFKKESITFVEQVQELATLATAEAHIKVIIEEEDNKLFGKDISVNLPGTKREVLLIVPATVIAGVDLKGITSNDIKVNDNEKLLEIDLPRATFIQDPTIQMDSVKTFSDEGLFRGEVQWKEGFDLAAEAQVEIKKEAMEIGLLESAETSAEKVLKGFFSNLGYTVKITFK